jgi:hypothetical protein
VTCIGILSCVASKVGQVEVLKEEWQSIQMHTARPACRESTVVELSDGVRSRIRGDQVSESVMRINASHVVHRKPPSPRLTTNIAMICHPWEPVLKGNDDPNNNLAAAHFITPAILALTDVK